MQVAGAVPEALRKASDLGFPGSRLACCTAIIIPRGHHCLSLRSESQQEHTVCRMQGPLQRQRGRHQAWAS